MTTHRIAYVGNFRPSASTETHLSATLEHMGHKVMRLQEDDIDWPQRLDAIEQFVPDIFMWTATWHENLEQGMDCLKKIREMGLVSMSYHLDLYVGIPREVFIPVDPFWHTDVVFTADGGHEAEFQKLGINHVWLAPGIYERECYQGKRNPQLVSDVIFVGNADSYHPEWPYRAQLVDWLQETYGRRFRCWGSRGGGIVRGRMLNDLYASAKVVVGDSFCPDFKHPRYWSDRIAETLGRGGFLIHPRIEGLEWHYSDGDHLRLYDYGDFDTLKELIDYYVANDDERRQIAVRGLERTKSEHTYTHRLREALSVLYDRFPALGGWKGTFRDETDREVVREVFSEDVYRAGPYLGPGSMVVDLGAHMGTFSIWCQQRGAQVIAVEPYIPNAKKMEENLRDFGITQGVSLLRCAVRGHDAYSVIHEEGSSGDTWMSDEGEGATVRSMTLNQLLDPLDHVDVLKADIEGAEYEVFAAASTETIKKCRYIVMEFHGDKIMEGRHAIPPDSFGRLVSKLSATHRLDILGDAADGGYLFGRRYGG